MHGSEPETLVRPEDGRDASLMLAASRSVSIIMPDLVSIIVKFTKFSRRSIAMRRRTERTDPVSRDEEATVEQDQEDRWGRHVQLRPRHCGRPNRRAGLKQVPIRVVGPANASRPRRRIA